MTEQPKSENSPENNLRPLTRSELRTMWIKTYGEQDIALQTWIRLAETQGIEIDVMVQMQGLLIFGTLINTQSYAQFYHDLHEEMYRKNAPETADFLHEYYDALVPPVDQPEIGPEGLHFLFQAIHLRDVTIMSAGHKIKVPYWRGQLRQVDAFVLGASAG